jgi:hypothetical protein
MPDSHFYTCRHACTKVKLLWKRHKFGIGDFYKANVNRSNRRTEHKRKTERGGTK